MLKINFTEADALLEAMRSFEGNVEETINQVLHEEAGPLVKESIQRLIPVSGRTWKGKAPAARTAKSLMNVNENLAVTTKTSKRYQYLYFPNDGTNTRRHVGNQQFFETGGEAVKDEIIERCITKLTTILE